MYDDSTRWGRPEKPLYDPESGLAGKPDYLYRRRGEIIPVEVKSGAAPSNPYEGHVLQLGRLLLSGFQNHRQAPALRLIELPQPHVFDRIHPRARAKSCWSRSPPSRQPGRKKDVPRSHESPARCASCGYRKICDQKCDCAIEMTHPALPKFSYLGRVVENREGG